VVAHHGTFLWSFGRFFLDNKNLAGYNVFANLKILQGQKKSDKLLSDLNLDLDQLPESNFLHLFGRNKSIVGSPLEKPHLTLGYNLTDGI